MHRRRLTALAVALIGAMLLVPAFANAPGRKAAPNPKRFASEIDNFKQWDAKNAWPANGILLTGSSSMRMWKSRESFPDLPVINRGFGGAEIPDVLYYYDVVVKPYAPRVILFYCGDNDIADNRSSDQVVEDFTTFLHRVHKDFPKTRVIYLPAKPSIMRWILWPQMHKANNRIKAMADKDNLLTFANTDVVLLGRDGKPRKDLFRDDGLHLNDAGYKKWTAVLKPLIHDAMK